MLNDNEPQIISIYIDSLVKLRNHTPSVETLNSLAPFFTSAFWRMPPPALGPLAFETFWKATYHEKPELLRHIPEKLKASIKGFDDAFGGGLTAGWSHDTESQITVCRTDSFACGKVLNLFSRTGCFKCS